MSNYSTKAHIDKLIQNGNVYWRVKDVTGKQLLAENDDISEKEESAAALWETVSEIQGVVKISLSTKNSDGKKMGGVVKNFDVIYKGEGGSDITSVLQGGGGGGLNNNMLLGLVIQQSKELSDLRVQATVAELKREMDAMRAELTGKGQNDVTDADKMMQQLYNDVKFFVMRKEGIATSPNNISGTNTPAGKMRAVKTPRSREEANEIINASIQDLATSDPHIIENLQMLANLARTDPDMYKQAVNGLNSISNTGT